MANISDAWGDIEVQKVGQEFLDFLKVAQKDGYYLLVESESEFVPDSNGDLVLSFSTGGRWAYENNLNGYLGGEWMQEDEQKDAYAKLLEALKIKGGRITVDYKDCDTAMDWMGTGVYELYSEEGELVIANVFDSEAITLEKFAELQGETKEWALEYIYGDEIAQLWYDYVDKEGDKAKDVEYWYANIYEEEE
jgi:hypothetical protein